jgi:hypothetical protein
LEETDKTSSGNQSLTKAVSSKESTKDKLKVRQDQESEKTQHASRSREGILAYFFGHVVGENSIGPGQFHPTHYSLPFEKSTSTDEVGMLCDRLQKRAISQLSTEVLFLTLCFLCNLILCRQR